MYHSHVGIELPWQLKSDLTNFLAISDHFPQNFFWSNLLSHLPPLVPTKGVGGQGAKSLFDQFSCHFIPFPEDNFFGQIFFHLTPFSPGSPHLLHDDQGEGVRGWKGSAGVTRETRVTGAFKEGEKEEEGKKEKEKETISP